MFKFRKRSHSDSAIYLYRNDSYTGMYLYRIHMIVGEPYAYSFTSDNSHERTNCYMIKTSYEDAKHIAINHYFELCKC